ncbi:unnamed protein product [Phaeothamnion confervicola]
MNQLRAAVPAAGAAAAAVAVGAAAGGQLSPAHSTRSNSAHAGGRAAAGRGGAAGFGSGSSSNGGGSTSGDGGGGMSGGGRMPKRRRQDRHAKAAGDAGDVQLCEFSITQREKSVYFERIRELYEQEQLCDVTFRVGRERFHAHRAVLAGHNTCLGLMMTTPMRESRQDEIALQDTDPKMFKVLLDYMYGVPISIGSDELTTLIGMAARYNVEGLVNQISALLALNVNAQNCTAVFSVADEHSCTALKEQAFGQIMQHFAVACSQDNFENLTQAQVKEVLQSDLILDCDESVVFDAAVRWAGRLADECVERTAVATEVLSLVRFPLMDAGLLSDVIKLHPLMRESSRKALLLEAYEHQALRAAGRASLASAERLRPRRRSCSFRSHTLLAEHNDAVSALTMVNSRLVSGSWDTTIKVWSTKTWSCERTLSDHTGTIRCFAVCAGKLISGSDDCSIKVWNPENWTLVRTLADHSNVVNAVIQCRDRLVSGGDDGTIKLWNTDTWQCEVTIHQEDHACGVLALAMCGDKLVSGSDEAVIKIWSTHDWTCEKTITDHTDEIWALTQVGDRLISGSIDSTIRVWDTEEWTCEKVCRLCTARLSAGRAGEPNSFWFGTWQRVDALFASFGLVFAVVLVILPSSIRQLNGKCLGFVSDAKKASDIFLGFAGGSAR